MITAMGAEVHGGMAVSGPRESLIEFNRQKSGFLDFARNDKIEVNQSFLRSQVSGLRSQARDSPQNLEPKLEPKT
jgi:hypothetical protein